MDTYWLKNVENLEYLETIAANKNQLEEFKGTLNLEKVFFSTFQNI
jgi:hypothetical protein